MGLIELFAWFPSIIIRVGIGLIGHPLPTERFVPAICYWGPHTHLQFLS